MQQLWRTSLRLVGASALLVGVVVAGSATFTTTSPIFTCSGSLGSPGTLAGTHSFVQVTGVCQVDGGPAAVTGDLIVKPGALLIAAFGLHGSNLTVHGNLTVQNGATLVLGCEASESPCLDDDPNNPTLNSADQVGHNLTATNALGVLVHNSTIGGNVTQTGGGGGFNCNPSATNPAFSFAVFSAYDDSSVGGNFTITNVTSCYLGVARVQVGGSLTLTGNRLTDADAIEILSNHVAGNLTCVANTMVWNSAEAGQALFPRVALPNTVGGQRAGKCVLASPAVPGGPLGPGPF